MALEVEQVALVLGGNPVLNGVSLQAEEGRMVGIIGPNGSGKSSLLRCMYRVLQPREGAVFLDGRNLEQMTARQAAQKLAVVAQHNDCPMDMTVEEMVLLGRSPYKRALEGDSREDRHIAAEALSAVGLEGLARRRLDTLSGGERQRAALARALAQQAPYLLLDEPTNHLDVGHQLQLMELVKASPVTVVAVMHDFNLAAMYCDRLCLMNHGAVAAAGTPAQVLTPRRIREVYQVEAQVWLDEEGRPVVRCLPVRPHGSDSVSERG